MSEKLNTEAEYRNDAMVDDDPLAELARIVAGEPEPVLETPAATDSVQESLAQDLDAQLRGPIDPQPANTQSPDSQPVDLSVEAALEDALSAEFSEDAPSEFAAEPEPPLGAQEITQAVNTVADPSHSAEQGTPVTAQAEQPEAFEDSLISALQEDFVSDKKPPVEAAVPAEPEAPVASQEPDFASFEDELSAQLEEQTAASIEEVAQELNAEVAVAESVQTLQPEAELQQDLGAAFDKEFEQMLGDGEAQAAAVPASEPTVSNDLMFEPDLVQEPAFEQVTEPVTEFPVEEAPAPEQPQAAALNELDFGSAFAEELGVDAIPEQSGWAEGETQATHDEFSAAAQPQVADDVYLDPGHDGDVPAVPAGFGADQTSQNSGSSQRYAIAALVIALFAGSIVAGYGFLGGGDQTSASGDPVVIKADNDPVKVKPDDPGGRVVANQDKATFTKVDGETDEGLDQESLISNTEEPAIIEPSESEVAGLAGAETNLPEKSDDRLSVGADEVSNDGQENSSVTPRVVQTVTVKPDGTILTSSPTAPAVPSVDSAVAAVSDSLNEASESASNLAATALPAATPVATAVIPKPEPIDGAQTSGSLAIPAASPLPKPEPQPVAVAAAPAPAPAPTPTATAPVQRSEWVVQVSSQRSAEAAQASFQNLRNRFSALQGRSMSIQRANVNGSTFFRVRVQTASRSDANQLCTGLKASGGSCFVTR